MESNVRETMTVHEALCELKTLGKRIDSAINNCVPVATKEHSSQKVNSMTMAEFKDRAISSHQSATDLIRRQAAIKSAINHYNAEKIITVAGKDYSIAQAIWMMHHGTEEKRELLRLYTVLYSKAVAAIERANGKELNDRAENAMNSLYGSKEKADAAAYNSGIEEYKRNHELELVDPLGIHEVILALEKEITDFESRVDAAIQVANATTVIEVTY